MSLKPSRKITVEQLIEQLGAPIVQTDTSGGHDYIRTYQIYDKVNIDILPSIRRGNLYLLSPNSRFGAWDIDKKFFYKSINDINLILKYENNNLKNGPATDLKNLYYMGDLVDASFSKNSLYLLVDYTLICSDLLFSRNRKQYIEISIAFKFVRICDNKVVTYITSSCHTKDIQINTLYNITKREFGKYFINAS